MDQAIHVIGIDLGTRFSCVSIWRNKKLEIIPDQFGNRTIPSIVAFYKSVRLVGHNALAIKDVNPINTIYDIKRIIGRRMTDPIMTQIKTLLPYELIDDQSDHHNILIQLDKSDSSLAQKNIYRPEEICAYVLSYIKKTALDYLHITEEKLKAVITVPAYFNDAQRQATMDAAKIAGLEIIKIINEPTAAALTYGMGSKEFGNPSAKDLRVNPTGGNVIMYDFGAGTLDVSLMNIADGIFRTLAVSGNANLGGEDIDHLIMNHVLLEFKKKHKIKNFTVSKLNHIKLKNAVENAKKILSTVEKTAICVDDFHEGKKLYYSLKRETLEEICNELFLKCMKPLRDVLDSAKLSREDIDEVILVGGSTRIPAIQNLILNFFNGTNVTKLTCSLNPDEVVSAGASIYGYIMTHNEDPFSENLVLLDIIPLSLGVETLKKQMTVIIPRNTVIPTKKVKVFSTDEDEQDSVTIKVFEGERKLTKNNFHVGTFDLCGFKKAPRGHPIINITFHVDINGILQVTAHEKRSGVENTIQITSTWGAKGRLSKTDIDNIIIEAEKNDQMDTLYSTKIGMVHHLTSICQNILTNLNDHSFNLTQTDRKRFKIDIENNLKWLKDKNFEELTMDELENRSKRLEQLYSPMMAQANKEKDKFEENQISSNVAEIYGDDDQTALEYEKVQIREDPSEYDKEEIKALKKTIFDLGKNILNVINNPVSNFAEEDIVMMSDYISSVNLWLYTTAATTSIEFVGKINEINKMTEEIMSKYDNTFEKNDNFTVRDELQMTCLALNTSSRYFNIDSSKLMQLVNETMLWVNEHPNEEPSIYRNRLDQINDVSNEIYHNMNKEKILEHIDKSDESEEDVVVPIEEKQSIIKENINSIIDSLPDRITKRSMGKPKEDDVLLKIDVVKLTAMNQDKYAQ